MSLGSILDEAKEVITGGRQDDYGKPEDSFALIGELWTSYLTYRSSDFAEHTILVDSADVARMMALLKIARMVCGKDKRDNYVDGAGYLDIAWSMDSPESTQAAHATDKAGAETSRATQATGIDSAWDKAHERARA